MKINKIQVNGFGNLQNKNIEFMPGINLIHGTNEAGKSTLVYFIKSMFYGIDKNKNGNLFSEVERFTPWSGQEFSGKIEYMVEGKKFSAFRDFNRNHCKVYDETGEDITAIFPKDKSRGVELGFTHLGIDEETFLNSICVSQGETKVEASERGSIIQKLTNIIQSGEESISYDQAKEKLHKKLLEEVGTERTRNKPLNHIVREIEAFEKTRDELIYNRDRKEKINEKGKQLAQDVEHKQLEIEDVQQVFAVKEKYARITSEREKEYEISLKVLEKEKEEREKRSQKTKRELYAALGIVCFLIVAVLLWYQLYPWVVLPLLAFLIGALMVHHFFSQSLELLPPQNIDSIREMLKRKEKRELEMLSEEGLSDELLSLRLVELKNLRQELEKEKEDILLEEHKLKIEEESISKHLERLNDVEEQLYDLYEKEEELRKLEYSIKLADSMLDSAYEELRQSLVPRIEKTVKKNIAMTTNGKYTNAVYNDRQGILFENEMGNVISAQKLSMGTIDQVYLGFRLAMSEEMGNVPLFLDETFAYYDDERLTNILKSLDTKEEIPQVLIMTCTDREKRILDSLGIAYHEVELA